MYKTDTTNFKFTPQKNSAETLLRSDVLTKKKHGQPDRCQYQQASAPLPNSVSYFMISHTCKFVSKAIMQLCNTVKPFLSGHSKRRPKNWFSRPIIA